MQFIQKPNLFYQQSPFTPFLTHFQPLSLYNIQ